jgi:6-pyruvoyltetrahydropterin/6-carboxytetrahydropterin synthase
MYRVIRRLNFCYGHRILGHRGKCGHLHGHNGAVEVELGARKLDRLGMVADFSEVKGILQGWIDAELDHRMLLSRGDPLAKILKAHGEPVVLVDGNPTAENLARLIFDYAASRGLPVIAVRLWESPASCAVYSPGPAPKGTGVRRPSRRGIKR